MNYSQESNSSNVYSDRKQFDDLDYLDYWLLLHNGFTGKDIELIRSDCDLGNSDVLEVGCGTGRITSALAPSCNHILGIDSNDRLLRIARKNSFKSGLQNVQYQLMNAESLDVEDESVDIVLFPWVLQQMSEPIHAVQEAHRVLKPNGLVYVIGRTDGDYDWIINQFVEKPKIDNCFSYEEPLKLVFSRYSKVRERIFYYYFSDFNEATAALKFALSEWYSIELNNEGIRRLQGLLKEFVDGNKLRLRFPASIYTARKEK